MMILKDIKEIRNLILPSISNQHSIQDSSKITPLKWLPHPKLKLEISWKFMLNREFQLTSSS
jgi:hypothetical protein